jgi:hypothetical protein
MRHSVINMQQCIISKIAETGETSETSSGFRDQGSRKIGVFIQESGFRGHLFLLSNFFYTFRKKIFLNLYLWNMEHLGTK